MAISIVRIKYLNLFEDTTWQNASAACWSIGELASGITCACLPTLRPLVSGYFPQLSSDVDPDDLTYNRDRKDLEASTSSSAIRSANREKDGFDGTALYDKFVSAPSRARVQETVPEEDSEEIMGLGSAREELESPGGREAGAARNSSLANAIQTPKRAASSGVVNFQRSLVGGRSDHSSRASASRPA